ncbi:hypothetical protein [Salmon gill poxvirus]|nr:hypothetical protein [Salmon gill poxvirus]
MVLPILTLLFVLAILSRLFLLSDLFNISWSFFSCSTDSFFFLGRGGGFSVSSSLSMLLFSSLSDSLSASAVAASALEDFFFLPNLANLAKILGLGGGMYISRFSTLSDTSICLNMSLISLTRSGFFLLFSLSHSSACSISLISSDVSL